MANKKTKTPLVVISLTVSTKDLKQLLRLMGELQGCLESSIENLIPPAGGQPKAEHNRLQLAKDRRNWKAAEDWVKMLYKELND